MKKINLFVVAVSLLSFAGCSKNVDEKIYLHMEGGSIGSSDKTLELELSTPSELREYLPKKNGKYFANWYYDLNGTDVVDFNAPKFKSNNVYACYVDNYFDYQIKNEEVCFLRLNSDLKDAEVVSYVDTYPLTTIASNAFEGRNLDFVSLGKNVENISSFAFNDASISNIYIGEKIKKIENGAFYGLKDVKNIFIEENNYYSSLGGMILKKLTGVERELIYYYAKNLSYFHENVNEVIKITSIAPYAINNIIVDEPEDKGVLGFSFYIPKSISKINDYTFKDCKSYKRIDGELIGINLGILLYGETKVIGKGAFANSSLSLIKYDTVINDKNIHVPLEEGVEEFEEEAFKNTKFKKITFPKSLKKIGKDCFSGVEINSIYYEGTSEEFAKIEIAEGNDCLKSAKVLYFSEVEKDGYWYYGGSDKITPYEY